MTIKRITGTDAIDFAEANGLTLSKFADPTEGAREGLSVDESREIAAEDPSLIYLDADVVYETEFRAEHIGDPSTTDADLKPFGEALEDALDDADWCVSHDIRVTEGGVDGTFLRVTIEHRIVGDVSDTIDPFVSAVIGCGWNVAEPVAPLATWKWEASQTLDDEPAWCADLVTDGGVTLAACFLTEDGGTDIDSDGCGVTDAGRSAGLTLDSVEWPNWGDAPGEDRA